MKYIKNNLFLKLIFIFIIIITIIFGMETNQNAVTNTTTKTTSTQNTTNSTNTATTKKPEVSYQTHVQNIGWQNWNKNGTKAGTEGRSFRLEAIKIKEENLPNGAHIKYQTHIQNIGWQAWKKDGELSGTTGRSLRLEAIKIQLENADKYSVRYRVHVQNIGWQDWRYDGEIAGTEGKSLRLEAIQIEIVDKQMHIKYQVHVQNEGWQDWKYDGTQAGTTGKSLRIEAIRIAGVNMPAGMSIKYKVHVQNIGWQDWRKAGEIAGTTGRSLRVEAIKIKIEGNDKYSVKYQSHVQNIGWQQEAFDEETSGTFGNSLRVESLKIKIVPKITENKTKIAIENPTSQIANIKQNISGWIMTSNQNLSLKIFLDDNELDSKQIKRVARNDILNSQKGYGNEDIYNKTPGFIFSYDFSKLGINTKHSIKVQAIKDNKTISESSVTFTVKKKIEYSKGTYGVSGLKAAGDSRGRNLEYFKYGSGPNVLFATFALHGFEDLWNKDGWELVQIANNFYNQLIQSNDFNISEKWTIYIFPSVNIDGLNYGYSNNGPGRRTLHSDAPNHEGIDLNRCWQVGNYTRMKGRNYNGTSGFQAVEARYLRDFMLQHKSQSGQTLVVDFHGWTQQVIGDPQMCSYYSKYFPENDRSGVGRYGNGYMINWARVNLGNSKHAAKSALIELPYKGINGHQTVINNNFSGRYINATLEMLRGM